MVVLVGFALVDLRSFSSHQDSIRFELVLQKHMVKKSQIGQAHKNLRSICWTKLVDAKQMFTYHNSSLK